MRDNTTGIFLLLNLSGAFQHNGKGQGFIDFPKIIYTHKENLQLTIDVLYLIIVIILN